jgi:hypothetical protein
LQPKSYRILVFRALVNESNVNIPRFTRPNVEPMQTTNTQNTNTLHTSDVSTVHFSIYCISTHTNASVCARTHIYMCVSCCIRYLYIEFYVSVNKNTNYAIFMTYASINISTTKCSYLKPGSNFEVSFISQPEYYGVSVPCVPFKIKSIEYTCSILSSTKTLSNFRSVVTSY